MLKETYYTAPTELDELIFAKLVPADHYLRQVKAVVDFTSVRRLVAECYSPDQGRGADDPVLLFKLCFLQFHYNLSDRDVLKATQVNLAYRFHPADLKCRGSMAKKIGEIGGGSFPS